MTTREPTYINHIDGDPNNNDPADPDVARDGSGQSRQSNRIIMPVSAYGYRSGKPGETNWCASCSQTKPFAKGFRCYECAEKIKTISDNRLMPDAILHGSVHHYTIDHIIGGWANKREVNALQDGNRRLAWFVLPPFQRPEVWTREQQVALIESIWLELPIGTYCYNVPADHDSPTFAWLIDGQQRISAILAYVADEFPVFGYLYSELGETDLRVFGMSTFPAIQLQSNDARKLEEIYNRLAYGGTPHEPKASL